MQNILFFPWGRIIYTLKKNQNIYRAPKHLDSACLEHGKCSINAYYYLPSSHHTSLGVNNHCGHHMAGFPYSVFAI